MIFFIYVYFKNATLNIQENKNTNNITTNVFYFLDRNYFIAERPFYSLHRTIIMIVEKIIVI